MPYSALPEPMLARCGGLPTLSVQPQPHRAKTQDRTPLNSSTVKTPLKPAFGEFRCDLSLGLEDAERLTAADHALTQPVAEPGIESLPVSPRLGRARSPWIPAPPGSAST